MLWGLRCSSVAVLTMDSDDEEGDEPPAKRYRPDRSFRRQVNNASDFTGVVVRWDKFCKSVKLRREIQSIVLQVNKTALEAYQLINLHVIRCLDEGAVLPDFVNDQNFYQRCLSGVNVKSNAVQDDLANEGGLYTLTRDDELDITLHYYEMRRPSENYSPPCTEGLLYLRTQLAKEMKTACVNHLVFGFRGRLQRCIRVSQGLTKWQAWDMVNRLYTADGLRRPDWQGLRDWLRVDPTEENIKANFNHFLRLSHEILDYFGMCPVGTPGVKMFSMMPLRDGFVPSNVTITNSGLYQIINKVFLKNRCDASFCGHNGLFKDTADFVENGDRYWWYLFEIEKYQTDRNRFAYEISTDGYRVSVLLRKPKVEPAPPRPLGEGGDYDVLIGGDPGMKNLVFARTDEDNGVNIKVTTNEYRDLAQMNKQRFWFKNLKVRYPEYGLIIALLPSLKVASFNLFVVGVQIRFTHCDWLLNFCTIRCFRKWQFKVYSYKGKAMAKLARRFRRRGRRVLIGIGDWSKQDGMRGRPHAPIKKFKQALRKHARVVEIDEYNTSKMCSICGTKCERVSYQKVDENGRLVFKNGVAVMTPCYQVIRCTNNACLTYWQRDNNSAANHLAILSSMVLREDRPSALRRN